jgi:2-polyprenyl-6-hydroxyphenyl methylase/3-demethylubiquinone-9 3-methyltransferase
MANVDSIEISQFEDLATRWWDPEGEFRPLHQINPLRLDYINRQFPLEGRKMLDLGCGGGLLSEAMEKRGAAVTGLDAGKASIAVAKLHAREAGSKIEYLQGSAEELARTHTECFDGITCMEMLEHVPRPEEVVAACAQMIRPGGMVFFSTINRTPKSWLFAIVGAEYVLGLLPRGTHRYDRFIRPSELESWANLSGFVLETMTGFHYNPLLQTYRLGPGTDVNFLMQFRRPRLA